MNVKALTIAGVAVALAIVVTIALNVLKPVKHEEVAVAAGPSAESVFSGSIDNPGTPPPAPAGATTTEGAAPAEAAPASEPPAETASAASAPGEPAPATGSTEPAAAEAAPAAEPVSSASAEAPAAETPTSSAPAESPPAETSVASGEPGADSMGGEPTGGSGAPAAAEAPRGGCGPAIMPSPATGTAGGKTGKMPETKTAAAPAPQPSPSLPPPVEMASSSPPPAAASSSSSSSGSGEPAKPKAITKAKPKPSAPPPKDARKAWWPAGGAGKLNIAFVGEASFTKAIVLLADGAFENGSSADANIKVTKNGEKVSTKWLVATNKKMLLLNVGPGKYTVTIGAGLKDASGKSVGASGSGPVYVH